MDGFRINGVAARILHELTSSSPVTTYASSLSGGSIESILREDLGVSAFGDCSKRLVGLVLKLACELSGNYLDYLPYPQRVFGGFYSQSFALGEKAKSVVFDIITPYNVYRNGNCFTSGFRRAHSAGFGIVSVAAVFLAATLARMALRGNAHHALPSILVQAGYDEGPVAISVNLSERQYVLSNTVTNGGQLALAALLREYVSNRKEIEGLTQDFPEVSFCIESQSHDPYGWGSLHLRPQDPEYSTERSTGGYDWSKSLAKYLSMGYVIESEEGWELLDDVSRFTAPDGYIDKEALLRIKIESDAIVAARDAVIVDAACMMNPDDLASFAERNKDKSPILKVFSSAE